MNIGVADGARTHDNRNHNPGLYQLSYSHRKRQIITAEPSGYCTAVAKAVSSLGRGTEILTLKRSFKSW